MNDSISQNDLQGNLFPQKQCKGPCGRMLPATLEYFHYSKTCKHGVRLVCKECRSITRKEEQRNSGLHLHGITADQYDQMFIDQNGVCAVCKMPETCLRAWPKSEGICSLAVDHCHATNVVRSLLCQKCNIALGFIEKDIERTKKLIEYAKLHQSPISRVIQVIE